MYIRQDKIRNILFFSLFSLFLFHFIFSVAATNTSTLLKHLHARSLIETLFHIDLEQASSIFWLVLEAVASTAGTSPLFSDGRATTFVFLFLEIVHVTNLPTAHGMDSDTQNHHDIVFLNFLVIHFFLIFWTMSYLVTISGNVHRPCRHYFIIVNNSLYHVYSCFPGLFDHKFLSEFLATMC